jgi:CubicO group peptidase (beta-lactamase class C family)
MKLRSALLSLVCAALLSSSVHPQQPKVPPSQPAPPAQPAAEEAGVTETPHEMTAADLEAFLDGFVPMQLERENIAGAVVLVVKDGKVLFARGYGYSNVEKKTPVSVDATLFRPGSISKLFTWTAVMQLVEQGKLDLDRDVNTYLDFKIPATFSKPITLRNLMTHTPGFEEQIKDLINSEGMPMASLRQHLVSHVPARIFPPGVTPAYSNYGAALAGYIVERVSGKPFNDYVAENIFKPLQMSRSTFAQPLPSDLKPLMSSGYTVGTGKAKPFEIVEEAPAGALSTTAADIAHFMIAHLQDGKYEGGQILRPEIARVMHSWQFGLNPALNGMCLGFYEESRNGHRIIGHGGDTVYFHSDLHLVLDAGVGFFVSYNSRGKGDISPRTALWQHFLDRYFP